MAEIDEVCSRSAAWAGGTWGATRHAIGWSLAVALATSGGCKKERTPTVESPQPAVQEQATPEPTSTPSPTKPPIELTDHRFEEPPADPKISWPSANECYTTRRKPVVTGNAKCNLFGGRVKITLTSSDEIARVVKRLRLRPGEYSARDAVLRAMVTGTDLARLQKDPAVLRISSSEPMRPTTDWMGAPTTGRKSAMRWSWKRGDEPIPRRIRDFYQTRGESILSDKCRRSSRLEQLHRSCHRIAPEELPRLAEHDHDALRRGLCDSVVGRVYSDAPSKSFWRDAESKVRTQIRTIARAHSLGECIDASSPPANLVWMDCRHNAQFGGAVACHRLFGEFEELATPYFEPDPKYRSARAFFRTDADDQTLYRWVNAHRHVTMHISVYRISGALISCMAETCVLSEHNTSIPSYWYLRPPSLDCREDQDCRTDYAIATGDPAYCEAQGVDADACRARLSVLRGNLGECNAVEDVRRHRWCRAMFAAELDDRSLCDDLADPDPCLMVYGSFRLDMDACEDILTAQLERQCISSVESGRAAIEQALGP